MNETPTMTEDLFPADNSDAYDIVRNSDFMVSREKHTLTLPPTLRPAQIVPFYEPAVKCAFCEQLIGNIRFLQLQCTFLNRF